MTDEVTRKAIVDDYQVYAAMRRETPEPAQPAESPEARAHSDEFVDFARYLRNAPANPLDEKREVSVRMILTVADALAATTARPTERQHDTIRREGSCYWQAADDIMAFINALDSSEMSGKDVRSAIYGRCLEMRPKSRPTERGAVEDYNGHSANRYVPPLPEGCGLFAVNKTNGNFHYINHAGSWQGMPKLGRDRIAKAILDGWYEGNEEWDSPRNDMLQTRAYWAADAVLALTPPVTVAAPDQAAEVEALREALEPVIHWYQSDEYEPRPLSEIVTDIVADLQADRGAALKLAALDTPPATGSTMGGECEAVWRCAIGDATGALDVLKNKWLASRRKNEREAGLVLGSVLDLVWAARSPAASNYSAAEKAGKKLIERVRAALQNGGE